MRRDTPPSSLHGDELLNDEEEEMIYIGDADEVLDRYDATGEFDIHMDSDDDEPPPKDDSIKVFDFHAGSVFCCGVHPSGKVAVTGGEDDKAYVWDLETGDIVACVDHKDSVIFSSFSFDGAFLATADMAGQVIVSKCALDVNLGQPWSVVWEYQTDDVIWGQWHPQARVLMCCTSDGDVYVWKIPSGDTKLLKGHGSSSEAGKILPGGTTLACGYEDGSVKIWDLKTSNVLHHLVLDQSISGPVTSIDVNQDGSLLITGSSNGKALMTTTSTGRRIGVLDNGSELECLAICKEPQMPFIATGTLDCDVKIWDSTKQMVRHVCSTKDSGEASGVTKLLWVKHLLVTGCLDGALRIYEGRSGELLETLTGHRSEILDLAYIPSENLLLTTSNDKTARLFKSKTFTNIV